MIGSPSPKGQGAAGQKLNEKEATSVDCRRHGDVGGDGWVLEEGRSAERRRSNDDEKEKGGIFGQLVVQAVRSGLTTADRLS